jgi:peptidoglycan/xylan/chitin deacetylase (PgdA/CDA1 family)
MNIARRSLLEFILGAGVAMVIAGVIFVSWSNFVQSNNTNTQKFIQTNKSIKQRDLILGTKGADVWDLHQRLYELMPNEVTEELAKTDIYNETTQFYVTLFQLSQDLYPNGIVNKDTKTILNTEVSMPSKEILSNLKSMIVIDEDTKNVLQGEKTEYGRKVLYLTFNEGPSYVYTTKILELLKKYNVQATFFPLGQKVDKFPNIIMNLTKEGQIVANSTYSHINVANISESEISQEISKSAKLIYNITNKTPICFRPSHEAIDNQIREKIGTSGGRIVMWDVDVQDWAGTNEQTIVNHILNYAQNGEIILMYDGGGNREQTVRALEVLLPKMISEGWEFRALDCVR